jgi:hypothetical protein
MKKPTLRYNYKSEWGDAKTLIISSDKDNCGITITPYIFNLCIGFDGSYEPRFQDEFIEIDRSQFLKTIKVNIPKNKIKVIEKYINLLGC